MKHPGLYVPLDVNYARDRAIASAGEAAELLYVRGLAYAKQTGSDGHIPDHDLEEVGKRLRKVADRVRALVREGLWLEVDGGWMIRNWSRWNESSDEMQAKRARDAERQRRRRERTRDNTETPHDVTADVQRDTAVTPHGVTTPNRREENRRQVPTTSGALALAANDDAETNLGQVVAAYVDGAKSAGLPTPSERFRGKVGRDARRLAEKDHVPISALITAARSMGSRGWDDLDRELQRVAVTETPRPSTTDQRVADGLTLVRRYEEAGE